jgi:hypothetical protein
MKKFAIYLMLIGILVTALSIGVGILIRDNPEVAALFNRQNQQELNAANRFERIPENAMKMLEYANQHGWQISGITSFLLKVYHYTIPAAQIGAGCAAIGLLLLILVLLIKPVLSIIVIILLAGLIYFGYSGGLGPDVQQFITNVIKQVTSYMNVLVGFVKSLDLEQTVQEVKHIVGQ